jgi:acyl-CoA synthetase (AMP-forming)/AMP-acid ligase II
VINDFQKIISRNIRSNDAEWISDYQHSLNWSESGQIISNILSLIQKPLLRKKFVLVDGDSSVLHVLVVLAVLCSKLIYIPLNRTLKRNKEQMSNLLKDSLYLEIISNKIYIKDLSKNGEVSIQKEYALYDLLKTKNLYFQEIVNTELYNCPETAKAFFFTSGTTGTPRAIVNSDSNLIRGAYFVSNALKIEQTDVIGGTLTLDFDYGLNQVLIAILLGCKYICCPLKSTHSSFIKLIDRNKVTIVPVMPFIVDTYFSSSLNFTCDTVRMVTSSGGTFTKLHATKINTLFPNAKIYPMYGLSECFRVSILDSKLYDKHPNSVGTPIGDTKVRIVNVDNQKEIKEQKEVGEIWISGGCMTWGYFNNKEANERKFVKDENFPNRIWLKTGDLGYFSGDLLYICGRIDAQIKRFGIRISLDEVEKAYMDLLSTTSLIAVEIPNNETESDIGILISDKKLNSSIVDNLIKKLPVELRSKNILFTDVIPANYNGGKPDRKNIIDKYFR